MILGTYDNGIANNKFVKLYLEMNGANDGTTFTDSSPSGKTITNNANHILTKTAVKKFGTASAYSNNVATSFFLSVPDSSDWIIGQNVWTISGWFYCTDTSKANYPAFGQRNTDADRIVWIVRGGANQDNYLIGTASNSSKFQPLVAAHGMTDLGSDFVHVEISCDSSIISMFWNGVKQTVTNTPNPTGSPDVSSLYYIFNAVFGSSEGFIGYIDNFMFIKGRQLHNRSFTPPNRAA